MESDNFKELKKCFGVDIILNELRESYAPTTSNTTLHY
jgi:hypothetical protein